MAIIMGITLGMLYWNFHEQQIGDNKIKKKNFKKNSLDNEKVKQVSIILDHWGKKKPSKNYN